MIIGILTRAMRWLARKQPVLTEPEALEILHYNLASNEQVLREVVRKGYVPIENWEVIERLNQNVLTLVSDELAPQ